MRIALAKSRSARETSHQSASTGSLCSMASYYWANAGSVNLFLMVKMVLLLWVVDAILGDGYGT